MFDVRVVTAEEMRALDVLATERYGIPSILLMENAGRAVCDTALEMLGDEVEPQVLIVAGPGNNGGDGFVAARHLHNAGVDVQIFYFGDREKAKGDALTNIEIAEKMGLDINYSHDLEALKSAVKTSSVVIDALLGTGVKGVLKPEFASVIGIMNRSFAVLAVDIPSGLSADRRLDPSIVFEYPGDAAVEAAVTVTLAFPKVSLLVDAESQTYTGRLVIADIGIPREALEPEGAAVYALVQEDLHPRAYSANKGTFGHVAVIAGSVGMTGAATLTAQAALRSGAGLVTVAVPESLNDIMEVKLTEAMTIPVPEGNARAFGMASLEDVLEIINKCDGAAIGPGFGRDEDTVAFTLELIKRLKKPSVIDADALYAISKDLSVLKNAKAPLVLTPHPGEMARLLGKTVEEVQSDRLGVARDFAKEYGVTLVMKGARTIVAEPGGKAFINTTGNPGMATGGTGDVLTGLIAGLMVQGPDMGQQWIWANTAVYSHGKAGDLAAEELGECAMIASNLLEYLPQVLRSLERQEESEEE